MVRCIQVLIPDGLLKIIVAPPGATNDTPSVSMSMSVKALYVPGGTHTVPPAVSI